MVSEFQKLLKDLGFTEKLRLDSVIFSGLIHYCFTFSLWLAGF